MFLPRSRPPTVRDRYIVLRSCEILDSASSIPSHVRDFQNRRRSAKSFQLKLSFPFGSYHSTRPTCGDLHQIYPAPTGQSRPMLQESRPVQVQSFIQHSDGWTCLCLSRKCLVIHKVNPKCLCFPHLYIPFHDKKRDQKQQIGLHLEEP